MLPKPQRSRDWDRIGHIWLQFSMISRITMRSQPLPQPLFKTILETKEALTQTQTSNMTLIHDQIFQYYIRRKTSLTMSLYEKTTLNLLYEERSKKENIFCASSISWGWKIREKGLSFHPFLTKTRKRENKYIFERNGSPMIVLNSCPPTNSTSPSFPLCFSTDFLCNNY